MRGIADDEVCVDDLCGIVRLSDARGATRPESSARSAGTAAGVDASHPSRETLQEPFHPEERHVESLQGGTLSGPFECEQCEGAAGRLDSDHGP